MGRIIKVRPGRPIPAQNVNMTLKMTKLVKPPKEKKWPKEKWPKSRISRREFLAAGSAIIGDEVAVDGLFWKNSDNFVDLRCLTEPMSRQFGSPWKDYATGKIIEQTIWNDAIGTYVARFFWSYTAELIGTLCGEDVTWQFDWQDGSVTGLSNCLPYIWRNGPYCVISTPIEYDRLVSDVPTASCTSLGDGVLSITANVAGVDYGPLVLEIEVYNSNPE